MKKFALFTGMSLISITLAACGGGHYDQDGNYVSYDTNGRTIVNTNGSRTYVAEVPDEVVNTPPETRVSRTTTETYSPSEDGDMTTTRTTTVTTYNFVKAGYYDANGFYIAPGFGPTVPQNMLPPAGLCRVWYPQRSLQDEPGVQSCEVIRSQVPPGAYVIFGG